MYNSKKAIRNIEGRVNVVRSSLYEVSTGQKWDNFNF